MIAEKEAHRLGALDRPGLFAYPAARTFLVMGPGRHRVLDPGPQGGLVHDAGFYTLQPFIPPAQTLLQETDARAGLGEIGIFMRPRTDQRLLRALEMLHHA